MTWRPKGKHVTVDYWNPRALGICDYSGFVHVRSEMVKQMEWRGNSLQWTGFYVGKDYADKPNEQGRPPILPPDPVPVPQPRVPMGQINTWNMNSLGNWNACYLPWNTIGTLSDGVNVSPQSLILQQIQNTGFMG